MLTTLCVFCGSHAGHHPIYASKAAELGTALAERQIRLVYGGGNVGIMGILADAVLAVGGDVTGVIPESLMKRELAHAQVTDMRIVESMHVRKALMAELSDGFVALPGGLGTLEELCEILTWGQLDFHQQPVAILNVYNYFDPLLQMLDRAVDEGFMSERNRALLYTATTVPDLLNHLLSARLPNSANNSKLDDLS